LDASVFWGKNGQNLWKLIFILEYHTLSAACQPAHRWATRDIERDIGLSKENPNISSNCRYLKI
jgi:hypothetical protein